RKKACKWACDSGAGRGVLDVKEPFRSLLLHLQGGVIDVEAIVQEELDPRPHQVAIAIRGDDDVGGEGAKTGRDGPDMEVVNGEHALLGADRRPSGVDVETR